MEALTIIATFAGRKGIEEEDGLESRGDRCGRRRSLFEDSPLLSAIVPDKDLQ
jgi:hypothetical protein